MSTRHSEYAVKLSRYILKPIGLWSPPDERSCFTRFLNLLQNVMSFGLLVFLVLPCALHTFLEEQNPAMRIKLIGPVWFGVMAMLKYTSLIKITSDIAESFQQVEDDWKYSSDIERQVMQKHAKIGRSLSIFSAVFMYGGGGFYHGIMPMAGVETFSAESYETPDSSIIGNLSLIEPKKARVLTYPTYNAWIDLDVGHVYQMTYLLQCFAGYVMDSITVGTCNLAATFVSHTCGQLELVIMMIRKFIDGDDELFPKDVKTRESRLALIIERHIRTLKFVGKVEKYLNGIFFVEFVGYTGMICLGVYNSMTEWKRKEVVSTATYFILTISFSINIFIFCYIGELLTEQCARVGSIYHIVNWYDLPGRTATDLLFIIVTSRHPAKLTAGKLVDLTLLTFTSVIKSAFTFFNLIRRLIT